MKTYPIILTLALVGTVGAAEHRNNGESADTELSVMACVHHNAQVPGATLNYAQVLAQKMFKTADVQLCWQAGRMRAFEADRIISIDLTSHTPASSFHPGALVGCPSDS
jgi:hypothetical protein